MRRIAMRGLIGVVALLAVPAASGRPAAVAAEGPALSYFMTRGDDCHRVRTGGCTPQSQTSVSLGYSAIYTFEDGTYVGADHGSWNGSAYTGPSVADIALTNANAVVADDVARSWGGRLRDAIQGAIRGKSRLVPSTNLGRAAAFGATPGARIVAAIGSAV